MAPGQTVVHGLAGRPLREAAGRGTHPRCSLHVEVQGGAKLSPTRTATLAEHSEGVILFQLDAKCLGQELSFFAVLRTLPEY